MKFGVQANLGALLENDLAAEILTRYFPQIRQIAQSNPQAAHLSFEQLVKYTRMPQAEAMLQQVEIELARLNTSENAISDSERELMERFQQIASRDAAKSAPTAVHHQEAIYPGQPWLDTKGERIQAHGGAVFYEDGVYYWYGEDKEHTDGKNGVWTWGIKVYASNDLYNWEDLGFLLPPVLDDPDSALFPTRYLDRPHLLKCPQTGKYVLWIKLSGSESAFAIWQADQLLGPYSMVENHYQPGNHRIGDFDMISDSRTGNGYIWFDADHSCILCMKLSDDYLHAEQEVSRSYPDLHPPFTREAPALFEHQGKKYMLTSGMTGYVPNQSDSAVSDSWENPFVSLGDPHIQDDSRASFNSQISKVFKVEGRENRFIAMADRWLPEYPVDARRADVFRRAVAMRYDPEHYQATETECREMIEGNVLETAHTAIADYVWLPVEWENDRPVIRWREKWSV